MSRSNITFTSNIYVIEGISKLSDKKFLAQVIDPGAIREIAKLMPKNANGSVGFSLPLHREIYDYSIPCAYGNGDYTHGVILENGKLFFVNTCENEACKEFARCRSAANYRKIVRTERITTENIPQDMESDDDFDFEIELPEKPRESKAQKLYLRKTRKREVIEEIKTEIHVNEFKRWGVRGFWRRLSDGTEVWVRPHHRHHEREEIESKQFVKRTVPLRYRFKDSAQLEKFRRILEESKRRARRRQFPEATVAQNNTYQLKKIKQIDSADKIVKSSLDSKILVNAGPGTGKTHTVIERLKYIDVNEEDVMPDSVLVLCFSRSAVKVIRDRLSEAIDKGDSSPFAKRFTIMTFDSFATWYLMQTEPKRNLSCNSYDDRIKMFIQEYEHDVGKLNEALSYLIVDEVQDLVGVRAEMVQSLLKHIECGFLLLGDECQAIYDYQINDVSEMNAAKLYFNAIKDLGTASTIVRERMRAYISSLLNGKFVAESQRLCIGRLDDDEEDSDDEDDNDEKPQGAKKEKYKYACRMRPGELTSRRNATEVKNILDELKNGYKRDGDNAQVYKYILSSNMFSVGVDIDRLGLMVVYGQPKSNADYIQATGRVGRANPGLVFCLYNAFRSRDRSYYERFNQYHSCLYKYVEPTSVTPFSQRSIEKGLHSVFIALVRHLVPGMEHNEEASKFSESNRTVQEIYRYLLTRIEAIQPDAKGVAKDYLDAVIQAWSDSAGQKLVYNNKLKGKLASQYMSLLVSAEEDRGDMPVLNSVRNVENSSNIFIDF